MKKFLYWLLGILVVLILLLVLAMFLAPKKLVVKSEMEMKAPAKMIYNVVSNLETWPEWSAWHKADTAMVVTLSDKTRGLSAKSSWTSETEGNGSQEFVEAVPGESLKTLMLFEGFDGKNYANWKFTESNGSTKVTWDMGGAEVPFLFRPFNWMMKGQIAEKYEQSLKSLKSIVEKRANENVYSGYKINETEVEERHFIMNRQEVPLANISQFYSQNLGILFAKIQKAGVQMDGMPSGLFFKYDLQSGKTDMAAGLPLSESVEIADATSFTTPSGRALQVDYFGDYNGTGKAHDAIQAYMDDNSLLLNPPMIEEYLTDPGTEKDPDKWLTRLTYFVAE